MKFETKFDRTTKTTTVLFEDEGTNLIAHFYGVENQEVVEVTATVQHEGTKYSYKDDWAGPHFAYAHELITGESVREGITELVYQATLHGTEVEA